MYSSRKKTFLPIHTYFKAIVVSSGMLFGVIDVQAQYKDLIKVQTGENMLLLGVNGDNKLQQITYGRKMDDTDLQDLSVFKAYESYPSFGINVSATGLRITHADGNMTTELIYQSKKTIVLNKDVTLTEIVLKDKVYPVFISLFYKAFQKENVIEQWIEVTHKEKGEIDLFNVASTNLAVDATTYHLTYFNGDWSNEFNMYETTLHPGIMTLDSKEGVRTAQKMNSSFLLSLNNKLQEETGAVIGGTLAWPGNWETQFDVDQHNQLRIVSGINPFAGNYRLKAGKNFKTPSFLFTFSENGAGDVTRRFHKWARNYGMQNGKGDRDVILNNWETTSMDFNEEKLSSLMKKGGELGFDLFLLDDGWFGNKYPRNTDQAGLGDWEVNKAKLPHGIEYLVKEAKNNNMKFGIWVEPEMVNPKSDLYVKHPDWALSTPNRPLDLQRNQLILDLANPKVQDYIFGTLDKLISENPGVVYLKWDCNRYLTNAWSNFEGKDKQSNLYTDYANGLLSVLDRFREKHPSVTMMLCASGGGRMDYGSMKYFDEYWPSDNSSGHERVKIQWGMNYFFPSIGFAGHVSEMGRSTPLKLRFDVGMAGKLGMDLQPEHLNKEEQEFSKRAIKTYKEIKDIVFYGDLYRLLSPYTNDRAALMYVDSTQKRALLFNYQLQKGNGGDFTKVYLRGLKPTSKYKLTEINKANYSRFTDLEGKVFTGKYLMEQGLTISMWNVDESNMILITEQ